MGMNPSGQHEHCRISHQPLLDDSAIEAIARRVSELLLNGSDDPTRQSLVSAAEIARRFDVSRSWVYENADRLGAVRLGRGARPRLRLDPRRVEKRLEPGPERA